MELLYGVKKFEVSGSFSGTDAMAGTVTGTIEATLKSRLPLGGSPVIYANEHTTFEYSRTDESCWFEADEADDLHGYAALFPVRGQTSWPGYLPPQTPVTTWPGYSGISPSFDIIKDHAGNYWLEGGIDLTLFDVLPPGTITGYIYSQETAATPDYLYFFATLNLSGSSHSIPVVAYSPDVVTMDAASLTITATEWHEYRTTAGLPAFRAVESSPGAGDGGLPINGGPGA
jgi:hypothetical protein